MSEYKVPLDDIHFISHEWLNLPQHYQQLDKGDVADKETLSTIFEEAAKFSESVIAPTYETGDTQGCHWEDGIVSTPTGFKDAYQQYIENGWPTLSAAPEFGGQGFPYSVGLIVSEMIGSANLAWSMYPGLTQGAIEALESHGTAEQQALYLNPMIAGTWSGTMCLTEPHCGSDLGLLRTKAVPNDNGTYLISGTKIFISAGEHDLTDNIIHLVLARLPDAPQGTKGISLFIVPKFLVNNDGTLSDRNTVNCASIEHKMGLNGSATCVMNFDEATGFLLGEANRGLQCMFTMMNAARLGTAMQGICLTQISYQKSLAYARDRLQMRSLSGPKHPEKAADPIIVHPDVRRMLLTQKALVEGNRALAYYVATLVDKTRLSQSDEEKAYAELLLGFLTPICKGFMTETALETTSHGLQVFGGHGYIKEYGAEQIVRDARITTIYEGTTGIQALDLLGRKTLLNNGQALKLHISNIMAFIETNKDKTQLLPYMERLGGLLKKWGDITAAIGQKAMSNQDEVGAASVDYLMYSGYVTLAYIWLEQGAAALNQGELADTFYESKLQTMAFYFDKILPRAKALELTMLSGCNSLSAFKDTHF
ncbi:MAG: acyl-CoA dehydrogenase C-terminal domain-containing protein [Pseudomonadota bacterium]